jgi:hypothetical protein
MVGGSAAAAAVAHQTMRQKPAVAAVIDLIEQQTWVAKLAIAEREDEDQTTAPEGLPKSTSNFHYFSLRNWSGLNQK